MKISKSLTSISTILFLLTPSRGESLFQEIPSSTSGLDYTHHYDEDHPQNYLNYSGSIIGAICIGDVNGDKLPDIYLSGAAGENALYINQGGLKFSPKKLPAKLTGKESWGTGAALVDIDNDGDLDIYQCNHDQANQLFLNNGKGEFTELEGAAGLDAADSSLMPNFADVDNDGDLDMYLVCNENHSPTGRPTKMPVVTKDGVPRVLTEYEKHFKIKVNDKGAYTITEYGRNDYLFLNQGKDTKGALQFEDVSIESGISIEGHGLSSVWWDYDSDGDLDLYVANDFDEPDRLFRNEGVNSHGVPIFKNVIDQVFPHTSWSSMGSDVADINHDGLPDLFSVEMAATTHYKSKTSMGALTPKRIKVLTSSAPHQYMRNHLQVNTGMGFFQETANASGLSSSNWSWTAKFGDLDQDGFQDIFVSNGMARDFSNADFEVAGGNLEKARIGNTLWDLFKNTPPRPEKNIVYQNLDGKKFKKRADWGLGLLGMSYSSAMADLDNDGDLDIVVSDLGKQTKIYRNNGSQGKSVRISLQGTESNRMGIGAKVVITDDKGIKRTRWMNPWTGFQSQNGSLLHFGLGDAEVKKIEVFWPSGIYQTVAVSKDAVINVVEKGPKHPSQQSDAKTEIKTRFSHSKAPDFTHKDELFDDFKLQPLLPQKLSQIGPCLAKGDIDGDGDIDFFVGGAKNHAGAVFINDKGTFTKSKQAALSEGLSEFAEDTAALMFDADGDGDLDLLVVSGSNEYELGDILYSDRLYLNTITDGKATFTPAPDGAFPYLADSGSCVVASDYDADGDLDLFIGSRSIPGKYPTSPVSRLIRNDSAGSKVKFTDITEGTINIDHMVTDALWADLNNDGKPDLAVATDWGPVKVFINKDGKLIDSSDTAGTSTLRGWWRSIHAADIDGDGDLDLIAGNSGVNTKYKSISDKYPAILYYGDLDGSGKSRIAEAKIQKGKGRPLPVRGRY